MEIASQRLLIINKDFQKTLELKVLGYVTTKWRHSNGRLGKTLKANDVDIFGALFFEKLKYSNTPTPTPKIKEL